MNKEETIIKYFSGTYAYDLFLMGMIFGNPIYSEYISNKEYLILYKKEINNIKMSKVNKNTKSITRDLKIDETGKKNTKYSDIPLNSVTQKFIKEP